MTFGMFDIIIKFNKLIFGITLIEEFLKGNKIYVLDKMMNEREFMFLRLFEIMPAG